MAVQYATSQHSRPSALDAARGRTILPDVARTADHEEGFPGVLARSASLPGRSQPGSHNAGAAAEQRVCDRGDATEQCRS